MSALANDILADLRQALLDSAAFAHVSVGVASETARWPRAEVHFASLDAVPADDLAGATWWTLSADVRVFVRGDVPAETDRRALELSARAREAVLEDAFRGQRCQGLPVGPATEVGEGRFDPHVAEPVRAVRLDVRCRFQTTGGA